MEDAASKGGNYQPLPQRKEPPWNGIMTKREVYLVSATLPQEKNKIDDSMKGGIDTKSFRQSGGDFIARIYSMEPPGWRTSGWDWQTLIATAFAIRREKVRSCECPL